MKKISYRYSELIAAQSKITPNSLGEYGLQILLDVLDEHQTDVERRLDEIMKEAKTSKPFYDLSGGR